MYIQVTTLTLLLLLLTLSSCRSLLAASSSSSSYNGTIRITQTSCTIFYLSEQYDTKITLLNCSSPFFTLYTWSQCFNRCCFQADQKIFSNLTYSSFHYCQQVISQSSQQPITILGIILIIVLSVVGTILVLCCVCLFCCKNRAAQHAPAKEERRVKTVEWEDQKEVNYNIRRRLRWSTNYKSQRPLKRPDQPCTICLDEITTAQLVCGHQYHPDCIGDWFKKGKTCPCCRREDIRGIKVYCRDCRWNYYVCTRTMLAGHTAQLPRVCQTCQKINDQGLLESQNELKGKNDTGMVKENNPESRDFPK